MQSLFVCPGVKPFERLQSGYNRRRGFSTWACPSRRNPAFVSGEGLHQMQMAISVDSTSDMETSNRDGQTGYLLLYSFAGPLAFVFKTSPHVNSGRDLPSFDLLSFPRVSPFTTATTSQSKTQRQVQSSLDGQL